MTLRRARPAHPGSTLSVRHPEPLEEELERRTLTLALTSTLRHLEIVAAQLRAGVHLDADRHHGRLDLFADVGEPDRSRGVRRLRVSGGQARQAIGRG